MKCPKCNEEMKKGEIMSQTGVWLFWQPDESCQGLNKMRYTKATVHKNGGIVLESSAMNHTSKKLIGFHCEECKTVIINY
ncbi:MAG: PF20097 family protein [Oscillospiraceae bacterium]|nr:PF20097 family protein [Oscillospiraceae bacterium]